VGFADDNRVPGTETVARRQMLLRMEEFLNLRLTGLSVERACAACHPPLSRKTYEKWRQRYDFFKIASDQVKLEMIDDSILEDAKDFAQFRRYYFGHSSPAFHLKIVDMLENTTPGSITMILVPPNHGKTTLLNDWMAYKLAHDPNHRILYVSEAEKLAVKQLGRLKRRMTDEAVAPKYIKDFGPFYEAGQEKQGKPWSANFFTVKRADHDEADYSVEGTGWSAQIYGVRSDTIVLDDFQTLKTAQKGNMTADMVEKFQQDIYTRIDPDEGRIIIIGTRVAQVDFYIRLIEDGVVDQLIVLPAIDWRGNPLWPERLPLEKLDKIAKSVGGKTGKVWNRAYMMRPQDDGSATFTEPVLNDCKNMSLHVCEAPDTTEEVWAGIDPAVDGFTAITTAALSPNKMRLMATGHWPELSTGEAIMARIFEMHQRTRFTKLVVEAAAFQKALARDERLEKMRRQCGFTIIEHQTGANKSDETFGFARMASSFIDQTIEIPWADEIAQQEFQPLLDELLLWRATIPVRLRTQDMGMSLWFVWLKWQQMRKTAEQQIKTLKTAGVPYKATNYKAGVFQVRGSVLR
jgi:hypothetical protein